MRRLAQAFANGNPVVGNDHNAYPAKSVRLPLTARRFALLASTSLVFFQTSVANAACTFVPTAGNDAFICDSGTSAGRLTDLGR